MTKGSVPRDRLYKKLGIPERRNDPTLPDKNYFYLLGINEDQDDHEVAAQVGQAYAKRMQDFKTYGHIDRSEAGRLQKECTKAKRALSDPQLLDAHRQMVRHLRLDDFATEAERLHQGAVTEEHAATILKQSAATYGFPASEVDQVVKDLLERFGSWAVSQEVVSHPLPRWLWISLPVVFFGALVSHGLLAFLSLTALAIGLLQSIRLRSGGYAAWGFTSFFFGLLCFMVFDFSVPPASVNGGHNDGFFNPQSAPVGGAKGTEAGPLSLAAGDYSGWQMEGSAFGTAPVSETIEGDMMHFADSFKPTQSDNATGRLTSGSFVIEYRRLRFLIAGGKYPGRCCVNLVANGDVQRTATGSADRELREVVWDLTDLIGQTAHIEILDIVGSTNPFAPGWIRAGEFTFLQ